MQQFLVKVANQEKAQRLLNLLTSLDFIDSVETLPDDVSKSEKEVITTPENKGWQKGFFEEVIGGWEGEPLVREAQPEQQERDFLL